MTVDHGITHVALPVTDLSASLDFYGRYARMQVVHRRTDADSGTSVAWISDLTRPFVLVLIEAPALDAKPDGGLELARDYWVNFADGYRAHQIRLDGGDCSTDSFCYPSV